MHVATSLDRASAPDADLRAGCGAPAEATAEVLRTIDHLLTSLDHSGRARLAAADRVQLVEQVARVSRRVDALKLALVGEAEAVKAAEAARGTPLKAVLTADVRTTPGEAGHLVHTAREVHAHPATREALLRDEVSPRQARVIAGMLDDLPDTLTTEQRAAAEGILIEKARIVSAQGLPALATRVLDEVAPEVDALEDEQQRLETRTRIARANRFLRLTPNGRGAVLIEGSLAAVDAVPLVTLVDAYADAARRAQHEALDRLDPRAVTLTADQRRADALLAIARDFGAREGARHGPPIGPRPRVVVVMNEQALHDRAEQAGLLAGGETTTAGELRRLCCDADLVPVVLGGDSEPLDVGTTHRLVTPPIRQALVVRDGGCAFPGCGMPAHRCEAHHVTPWWAGGATTVSNLVLLCPHHHGVVEPPRFWHETGRDHWRVNINGEGLPEFIPPWRQDHTRTPVLHERHRLRREQRSPSDPALE